MESLSQIVGTLNPEEERIKTGNDVTPEVTEMAVSRPTLPEYVIQDD